MSKFSDIHDSVISVMTFVEKLVPDGTPGLAKLDLALKIILKVDASLTDKVPLLKLLFTTAKATFNEVKTQFGEVQA